MRSASTFFPLVLTLASLGCAGAPVEPGADQGAMADAGPAPQDLGGLRVVATFTVLRGVYFVPERRDVSTYEVDEIEWTQIGNRAVLGYHLPRLLDGRGTRVTFTGSLQGNPVQLRGDNGTADCTLAESGLPTVCEEEFVDLDVDLDRVRREAEDLDPGRVDERVAVAVEFMNDPIGVLEAEATVAGTVEVAACERAEDCPAGVTCDRETGEPLGVCRAGE